MNAEPSSKLAEVVGALAIELQARTDPAATLRGIVDASVDIVPGARWAGISLIHGRRVQSEVSTDPIVTELDQLQTDLGEGPCVSALREHHTVEIEDMSTETRWPRFVRRASALGAVSFRHETRNPSCRPTRAVPRPRPIHALALASLANRGAPAPTLQKGHHPPASNPRPRRPRQKATTGWRRLPIRLAQGPPKTNADPGEKELPGDALTTRDVSEPQPPPSSTKTAARTN